MASENDSRPGRRRTPWWRSWWFVAILIAAGVAAWMVMRAGRHAARYVTQNFEPMLRQKVVETLSARFNSPVELDHLQVDVTNGLEVKGTGLRIMKLGGPDQEDTDPQAGPMISVPEFTFHTTVHDALASPTRIGDIHVAGVELHIPPSGERKNMFGRGPKGGGKIDLLVDHIVCDDMKLFIETDKPGKDPMEFDISHVVLTDVGADKPFLYDAQLTNPKPTGEIHATGHFGPWDKDEPRDTQIDGDYDFSHADLNSIHGLGGILSSTGHFEGKLRHITIDGTTDTPNFSLDISDHPMPLRTKFHAYVDGTTGDTTLDPVNGMLLHTPIVARGTVRVIHGQGHDIALDVSVPNGRMEDLLRLGMKSSPPVMRAAVSMKAKLHIPPGKERVAAKIELAGTLHETQISFGNPKVQDQIDSLSMRAQGHPKDASAVGSDREAEVASKLDTTFALARGTMTFSSVQYSIPGAELDLRGAYLMDGNRFDFKGHVKTDATASHMVTGWKALLLKPVDPFLKKDGAGMELPISITGSGTDLHFGLARHGSGDETTQQILEEVKTQPLEQQKDPNAKKSKLFH